MTQHETTSEHLWNAAQPQVSPPYSAFADVYDYLNAFEGIEPWLARAWEILGKLDITGGKLLDIGAGTCSSAQFWVDRGFIPFCLDPSLAMLLRGKARNRDLDCFYICGSYASVQALPSFRLVTAVNEVANYIAYEEGTLASFLATMYAMLEHRGALIFDILTPAVESWIAEDRCVAIDPSRQVTIRRQIGHDQQGHVLTSEVIIDAPGNTFVEEHAQLLLEPEHVQAMLEAVGFDSILIGDLMISGLALADLPSADIIAIKK
jgi:SAM-dependent methyltransferase